MGLFYDDLRAIGYEWELEAARFVAALLMSLRQLVVMLAS